MKKKTIAIMMTAAMVMAMAAGCGSKESSSSGGDNKEASYKIGIQQFAEHGSLDNCREGFLEGLEEEGIKEGDNLKVEVKNAMADTATNAQIADSFVSDNMDLICAIATPSAQSAYNAAMDKDIPVVYTAVTDPVAAELADKDGNPVTGSYGGVEFDRHGEAVVSFCDGEQVYIEKLPVGTSYQVTEVLADKEGYQTSYETCEGTLSADRTATVINRYREEIPDSGIRDAGSFAVGRALVLLAGAGMLCIALIRRRRND